MRDKATKWNFLKILRALGINISKQEIKKGPFPATPDKEFTSRKTRYTIQVGERTSTRECDINILSTQLRELIGKKGALLLGIDGINGFQCGAVDEDISTFSHELEKGKKRPTVE